MGRILGMLVAVGCYFAFFAAFVYFVGFSAGFALLPTHVDKGMAAPAGTAALIDLGLIALFGLQHSVMARQGFKAGFTRIVPASLERSFYCLASAAALAVLYAFWHPIGAVVWSVSDETARLVIWGLFFAGFGIVFLSTWLISHFELFGLAQAWSHLRERPIPEGRFVTPLFYKLVRHPIYTGFALMLWASPHMTMGHLLFAVGMTAYLLIGIRYEERDLVARFGNTYVEYSATVGMIVPGIGKGVR